MSRMPAGISRMVARMASRVWRTRRTSPSEVRATIPQAPGCRTISRSPAGHVSTSTRIRCPWNASREDEGSIAIGRPYLLVRTRLAADDHRLAHRTGSMRERRADELPEQRVGPGGTGPELGVELPGHEVRVVPQLDDL